MGLLDYFGYPVRKPYQSEDEFFKKNKNVSGMATEDNSITLNPHAGLLQSEYDAVGQNEAARLWMKQNEVVPNFGLTPEQQAGFIGTPYENDALNAQRSLIGRIISNDPSAKNVTGDQQFWADWVLDNLRKRK